MAVLEIAIVTRAWHARMCAVHINFRQAVSVAHPAGGARAYILVMAMELSSAESGG